MRRLRKRRCFPHATRDLHPWIQRLTTRSRSAPLLEGLPDAAVGAGPDGLIVFVNALAEAQFGYRRDELVGRPIEVLWPERVRARYRRNLELYFELEHPLRFSDRAYGRRKDGTEFVGEMSWGIVETDKGPLLLAIGRDVSERLEAEARLRRQSEQQAAVAALGERALRGVGPSELSEEAAERVRATLGVDRVAVLDGPKEIAAWGAVEAAVSRVSVPIHTGDEVHGALVAAASREDAFGDEEGLFLQAVANVLAIAFSRLQLEERIRHQALHDPLTGLANRALCRDRIEHALALLRARRQRRRGAVRRPRQLQARQRPLRPRGRRRAADRARRAGCPPPCARPTRSRASAATSSSSSARTSTSARRSRSAGAWRPRCRSRPRPARPALGQHRDRVRHERRHRPRRADRPRRRRGLPGQGARQRRRRDLRRGAAAARADRVRPRTTSRARSSAASSSSSSSRSSRSPTARRSGTRRCCAGAASAARRSTRRSSSRSPRSRG